MAGQGYRAPSLARYKLGRDVFDGTLPRQIPARGKEAVEEANDEEHFRICILCIPRSKCVRTNRQADKRPSGLRYVGRNLVSSGSARRPAVRSPAETLRGREWERQGPRHHC